MRMRTSLMLAAAVLFAAAVLDTFTPVVRHYLSDDSATSASAVPVPAPVAEEATTAPSLEQPSRPFFQGDGLIARTEKMLRDSDSGLWGSTKRTFRSYLDHMRWSFLNRTAWLWILLFLVVGYLLPTAAGGLLTPNKMVDLGYPLFQSTLRGAVIFFGYEPVRTFYANHLSFLDLRLLDGLPIVLQGFLAFLVADLAFWFSHWTRHKVPWLWYFHAVHHSQTEMTPMTVWRTHPLESLLIYTLTLIPVGIFGGDKSAWLFVTAFTGIAWSYFIHSNIRTNLGFLNRVIVSPQFHRVHHSRNAEQYDLNFGEHIILWDWLFGTIERNTEVYPDTGIPYGEFLEARSATPAGIIATWLRHTAYPFIMIGRSVKRKLAAPTPAS